LSELEVQDAINRIALDHTVILIAHRLTTIRDADKIVVLEAGRILEQGDHDTLMGLGGIYRHLYTSQEEALTDTLNEVS
jgi:ABC-type multidrug transport system fused ATPase/permease subunit